VVRFTAPYADPVLIPAVALVNGLGVAFLRRLDIAKAISDKQPEPGIFAGTGGRQLAWTLAALILAAVLLLVIRDHKIVSRYAYTLGLVGIVLVMIPAVLPRSMSEINGAKLWIKLGGFTIQPGEFPSWPWSRSSRTTWSASARCCRWPASGSWASTSRAAATWARWSPSGCSASWSWCSRRTWALRCCISACSW